MGRTSVFRRGGLAWALAAMLVAWAACAHAEPWITGDEILTEDQLQAGMKGYAKSVFHGTKVESFPVTIIGVLEKIDFGGNVILIRVDGGPVVKSKLGIVAGMSGSPVFVNDRLVGAIAFSWEFVKEPIAGVTPIRQMLESFEPGSSGPAVKTAGTLRPREGPLLIGGRAITKAVVSRNGAAEPGTMLLRPVATPVFVSGLSGEGRRQLERALEKFGLTPVTGPGRMSKAPPTPPLEPGSAIGAQLMSGDVDATAIGTVTWAKNGKVLAFGHPLLELGAIDLPLTGAYVHGVVPSQMFSMKIASPLGNVGRFTQDRPWCVGGVLGEMARMIPISMRVKDLDRDVSRQYRVEVIDQRNLTRYLAFSASLSAVGSLAPPWEGTTTATISIKAEGLPEIRRASAFTSGEEASFIEALLGGSPFAYLPVGELMEVLSLLEDNPFGRARLVELALEMEVTGKRRSALLTEAHVSKVRVKPGDKVEVTARLQPYGEEAVTKTVTVEIPKNAPPGRLQLGVAGGLSLGESAARLDIRKPEPASLMQLASEISTREKSSDLVIDVVPTSTGLEVSGVALPAFPNSLMEAFNTTPGSGVRLVQDYARTVLGLPWVTSGSAVLNLTVETDEKEKAGPRRGPTEFLPGFEVFGELFGGLMQRSEMRARAAQGEPSEEEGLEEMPPMPSWEEVEELGEMEPEEVGPPKADAAVEKKPSKGLARLPGVWKQATQEDFSSGKTEGTMIGSDGKVSLAPAVKTLMEIADETPWTVACAGDTAYLGTWPSAKVYQVAGGQAALRLDADGVGIGASASTPSGDVYVAAIPGGAVYEVSAAEPRLVCRLGETYVWALAFDGKDALYAGTGPRGNLYRIPLGGGEPAVVLQAPDRHVISLASDGNGTIYAGTYPKGKVYRIGADGRAAPLFETPELTIQCMAADSKGNVYVGTSPKAKVWKVAQDGSASLVLDTKERNVTAIAVSADGVYAATTGKKPKIYRLDDERNNTLVHEPQAANVLAMTADGRGGLFAAVGGSGRLLHLDFGAKEGAFTSSVHDAGTISDWGRISWQAEVPEGCSLSIQTRTGNTAYPDATWSDWSAAYAQAAGERVSSPAARYVQYQCKFSGAADKRPALKRVQVWYFTRNRAPEVKIKEPAGGDVVSRDVRVRWEGKDPDKDTLTYKAFYSSDLGKTWRQIRAAVQEEAAAGESDGPPAKSEQPESKDKAASASIEEAKRESLRWDTRKVKDGAYLLKVAASDSLSNPRNALRADAISERFTVDNTPPVVEVHATGGIPSVVCRDAGSYVAGAEYRLAGKAWAPLACADGIFDSSEEALALGAAELPAGRHIIEIRARDAAGNEAISKAPVTKTSGEGAKTGT